MKTPTTLTSSVYKSSSMLLYTFAQTCALPQLRRVAFTFLAIGLSQGIISAVTPENTAIKSGPEAVTAVRAVSAEAAFSPFVAVVCPTTISDITFSSAACSGGTTTATLIADGVFSNTATYSWASSNPTRAFISNTNVASPTIDWGFAGTVTISVTVTDVSGCSVTLSYGEVVTVHNSVTAGITPSSTVMCVGNSISLTGAIIGGTAPYTHAWTPANPGPNGNYSAPTSQSTNFTATAAGSPNLIYTVTDANQCSDDHTQPVTIYAAVDATIGNGTTATICYDGSMVLDGNATGGSGTYSAHLWELVSANISQGSVTASSLLSSTTTQEPTLTPHAQAADGDTYTFRYTATDNIGCSDVSPNITITIRKITSAALSLVGASTICENATTTFKVDVTRGNPAGSPTYTLVYNDGTADSTISNYVSGTTLTTRAYAADYTLSIVSIKDNRVTASNCVSVSNSGTPMVTVYNLSAGSITGEVTICSGDDPAALGSTAATGDGTITYLWESSTDGTTFTSTGITTETLDPGALTADIWYRRVATSTLNAVACSKTSNAVKVTVNNLTSGGISGAQTVCSGGDPAEFGSTAAGSGDGAITYQWQSSTTDATSGFSNIANATSATYDAPSGLTEDTWYRRVATSTISGDPVTCTATSNAIKVTVNNLSAGTISGAQTICSGGDPAAFASDVAGSGDGTITYQWQSSTTSAIADFGDISGATSETYDAPSGLTADTWYRRVATSTISGNAVTCTATSNAVKVTVNNVSA
ncbi:MAG: hypothetical protein ACR2K1_02160, partial [Saprospiraceae bacterium]